MPNASRPTSKPREWPTINRPSPNRDCPRNRKVSHIPGSRLAKTVVLHLESGPVLAVVPSSHRVDLSQLQSLLDRRLGLASETEIGELFDDCEVGAAPPVGSAYGVPTVLDRSLSGLDRVWFEGGDHRSLISVTGADFDRLMRNARQVGLATPSDPVGEFLARSATSRAEHDRMRMLPGPPRPSAARLGWWIVGGLLALVAAFGDRARRRLALDGNARLSVRVLADHRSALRAVRRGPRPAGAGLLAKPALGPGG